MAEQYVIGIVADPPVGAEGQVDGDMTSQAALSMFDDLQVRRLIDTMLPRLDMVVHIEEVEHPTGHLPVPFSADHTLRTGFATIPCSK